jgi:toxin HigB-1
MIRTFKDKKTEKIYHQDYVKGISKDLLWRAKKKLMIINSAVTLEDLKIPPGNKLESLKGDRVGYYSIRINDKWRICFRFNEGIADEVEIVDYH